MTSHSYTPQNARKQHTVLVWLLALMAGGCGERLAVYTTPADMVFPDANLKSCVVRFGREYGWNAAGQFTHLNCNNSEAEPIRSLEGIEVLSGLQGVDISFNAISDLAPLAALDRLRSIQASHNQLRSMSTALPITITELNLDYNRISDVAWVAHYPALRKLALDRNLIEDIGPLAELSDLQSLALERNRISSIAPLQGLQAMRRLELSGNLVSDLTPLRNLAQMRLLDLSNNRITSIDGLRGMTALTELDLANNPLTELDGIQEATAIERLWLDGTQVRNLAPLAEMPRLELVSLHRIEDLSCDQVKMLIEVFDEGVVHGPSHCD